MASSADQPPFNAPCRCGDPNRPDWRHGPDGCMSGSVDRFLDDALGPMPQPSHHAPCPFCAEAQHAGGPLSCPVLNDLTVKAMDVDVPARLDGEATTAYLARVLADHGAPRHMISLAADGHYDDYKSPLALPEMQLLADARENGLEAIAVLVVAGAFDSTKAESDAWAASPEGQAVFRELAEGASKNRARRRADEKKRRRGGN